MEIEKKINRKGERLACSIDRFVYFIDFLLVLFVHSVSIDSAWICFIRSPNVIFASQTVWISFWWRKKSNSIQFATTEKKEAKYQETRYILSRKTSANIIKPFTLILSFISSFVYLVLVAPKPFLATNTAANGFAQKLTQTANNIYVFSRAYSAHKNYRFDFVFSFRFIYEFSGLDLE